MKLIYIVIIGSVAFLLSILFTSCKTTPDIKKLIEQEAVLVDVRTPEEYAEGHVSGSLNIPVGELSNRLDELDKSASIVVFCRSGNRSNKAKGILNKAGFENVYDAKTWEHVKKVKEEAGL